MLRLRTGKRLSFVDQWGLCQQQQWLSLDAAPTWFYTIYVPFYTDLHVARENLSQKHLLSFSEDILESSKMAPSSRTGGRLVYLAPSGYPGMMVQMVDDKASKHYYTEYHW